MGARPYVARSMSKRRQPKAKDLRIGVDTGGTFTDLVVLEESGLRIHKVSSTPSDPAQAVLTGLREVRGRAVVDVVHGTTVGLNAVLTGDLARTAFVTNAGFEDLIEIGRQERRDLYDLNASKALLPVPRQLRFGVDSRRSVEGKRLSKPSAEELATLLQKLRRTKVEAVAIGLLHSYKHPGDEREIARALKPLGVPITCSADLLPRHGEFERYAASILNAATCPRVSQYLARLAKGVQPGQLRLMRSSGGILGAKEAGLYPARAMFSGPAGGVLASRALAKNMGYGDVATFDMGGTSTDVCLVQPDTTVSEGSIAGLPLAIPAVEVHTIGCGGGSIAWVDLGGALQVGPQSAGADPGPACYGKGSEATVTDAHMVLGHMGAETLLGGDFHVDVQRSVQAVSRIAKRLNLSLRRTAEGILEVAEVNMCRALLVITVQRAMDPAKIPLIAFGGAGGLHAATIRKRLSMPVAVIPSHPGTFSAVGLALAGESSELIHPVLQPLPELSTAQVQGMILKLSEQSRKALGAKSNASQAKAKLLCTAHLRYAGQGETLSVPMTPGASTPGGMNLDRLARSFAQEHERRFGFVPEQRPAELVEIRLRAELGDQALPPQQPDTGRGKRRSKAQPYARRLPPCGGTPWLVYRRQDLPVGQRLAGPCLLEELSSVTRVPAGSYCQVTAFGLTISSEK